MLSKIEKILRSDMHLTMDIVGQLNGLNGSFETYALYNMEDFDTIMEGYTPTEVVQRTFFGDFNPNDDYFYFNSYANLESITENDMFDHFEMIIDEVIDSMIYNYNDLYIDDDNLNDLAGRYLDEMK